jgi:gluconate 2-dehydrogenase gamma chain
MTRKQFLMRGLTASAVAGGGLAAGWFGAGLVEYMGSSSDTPWKVLTPQEAEELDRLAEELIPADPPAPENGNKGIPGAHDAKVVRFLDWQLAPDAPYARHLDAYRKHLALIREGGGQRAARPTVAANGRAGAPRQPMSAAAVEKLYPEFFKMLLRHVKQGFYGHPRHGGNAGWASYRMLGIAAPSVTGRNIPGKENHL